MIFLTRATTRKQFHHEFSVKTAREFASTSNNGTANSSRHMWTVSNQKNSSKPQQLGTFVIEHQKERSVNLRKKFVIPQATCRRARIATRWQKIILDTYQRPQKFYRQKIRWIRPTEFDSMVRILGSATSGSEESTWNKLLPAKQKREYFNSFWHISPDGSQRGKPLAQARHHEY